MLNIVLAGVGGQGTVLAAKVLATAAQSKGWKVRTSETIGMAQRGGSVVSHVRMGDHGEDVYSPLVVPGTADMVVAFEPGEAARNLAFLAPDGLLVTATTTVEPVSAALGTADYDASALIAGLHDALGPERVIAVDDRAILERAQASPKALNIAMLAAALGTGCVPISIDDLKDAVESCVRPRFVEMNLAAIGAAASAAATPAPTAQAPAQAPAPVAPTT